jgi:hypothetical protein
MQMTIHVPFWATMVVWAAGPFAYVVTMYALAFRLDTLRKTGRAPDAPTAQEFIWNGMGWNGLAFVFSRRHEAIADRQVSVMVLVIRASALIAALWIGVFALAWSDI